MPIPRTRKTKTIHFTWPVRATKVQDDAGDNGHLVALKDIGGHAGKVAHVIAHQVGHHRGVTRIVLGNARLHFADQVRSDIRGLGIYTAADPHDQRHERRSETETQQRIRCGFLIDEEDDHSPEQTETVGEHAGDGPGTVGGAQGAVEAGTRQRCNPDVALDGHAHSQLPDQEHEESPEHESTGPAQTDECFDASLTSPGKAFQCFQGWGHYVNAEIQHKGQDDYERYRNPGLPALVFVRADANGIPDRSHPFRAHIFLEHLLSQEPRISEPQESYSEDRPEGDALEGGRV